MSGFKVMRMEQIPREKNHRADVLAKITADGYLYRKGKSLPLLRCLHPGGATWALSEVHSGDCGNHAADETLAYQILRMGYFWLTVHQDAKQFAQSCEACQKTANLHHLPPERLSSISTPYPFAI
ncbi:hypothetical protein LWI28_014173 [Acer negundo]|uniref:Integrase zinc-binding domain-containing protein n=1 Tax=Acer negundo TaxID=4023 RepID=A0AAD5J4Q2_ACENE|nr:hypothetical protein LWI28_014173 [Acer negundo]